MITPIEYYNYFKSEKERKLNSGHYKSEPKFLFLQDNEVYIGYWLFDKDNWCGSDILRDYLLEVLAPFCHTSIKGYEIKYYLLDDTTHIFIMNDNNFYCISWYKSRGTTEYISKNGQPIDLEDYLELCNILGVELK